MKRVHFVEKLTAPARNVLGDPGVCRRRGCGATPTHHVGYEYTRNGHLLRSRSFMCDIHTAEFAARYGVEADPVGVQSKDSYNNATGDSAN